MLPEKAFNLASHLSTAGSGWELQFDQGIVEAESIPAAGPGQPQQLTFQRRQR
jgi:hypothetical protein